MIPTQGVYKATRPILTSGSDGNFQLDVNGNLKVTTEATASHISTATTTTVKSGAGFLHAITVNTTAAGSITIYDNTTATGTVLAVIKASVLEGTFVYNVGFATGLTIVTAGASDITVSYR
jgi:hypothetical protein